jgi:tetratricopeptide (TPR) repeat protein
MVKIRQTALLAAILLLLTVAAYSNSFHNSFHFDDSHTIVNNLFIRNIANLPLFFKDSTTFSSLPSNQSYRPVVSATLAIDYWLGKGMSDTFCFHLSSFIIFIIQGMLMVFFYRTVFDFAERRHANIFTALLAAGWYLLHPANAETINYIISRSDALSAMCIVLAFVLYGSSSICRKWHFYLLPIAVGMLTKPITFIFPVLLLFYVLFFEEKASFAAPFSKKGFRHFWAAAKKTVPAFLFILGMLIIIKMLEPPTWTPGGTSQYQYVITQPYVILKYFFSFFLPISLSADTDLAPLKSIADFRFFIGCLFLAALLAVAVITSAKERLRPISFGILWFFLTLLPTSLIPLAEVMNDHRVFLPYIGLMLSVCWSAYLIVDYCRSHTAFRYCGAVAAVFIAVLLTVSAYGTHQRNKVWKTEETLWRDVTEKSPGNGRGLMNYGLTLMAKGDYAQAEKNFLKALNLNPHYATLHINLGVLNEATGKPVQAEQYFKKAISLQPGYPEGYFYYARFLNKQNRLEEAIENLTKTLNIAAAHMNARYLLMTSYKDIADFNKAAEIARETLRIAPDDQQALMLLAAIDSGKSKPGFRAVAKTPEYYINLSLRYYRAGNFSQCIAAAQKALQVRPDYDLAYNNICAAYNELGQWDKAIEAGQRVVALSPGNTLARNNLAWAQGRKMAAASSGGRNRN